jgi:uncharacterized protein (TIGR00369 family)
VTGLGGLDLLRTMLAGKLPAPPISRTLDFLLLEADDGRALFQGTPGPAFLNPMGGIHGGWYATLLDSAMGCAVHSKMPPGRGYTTAELSINIVRAIGPKVQRVRAEGKVLHAGRQLATAEGRLYGPTARCMRTRRRPAWCSRCRLREVTRDRYAHRHVRMVPAPRGPNSDPGQSVCDHAVVWVSVVVPHTDRRPLPLTPAHGSSGAGGCAGSPGRRRHHRGHVPVEQRLVAQALEAQRHVFGGAAEQRVGDRVGQADAQRAHLGGNSSAFTMPLTEV